MKNHYWESRQSMTPQKAFQFLTEGHDRFINNLRMNRNMLQLVNDTKDQQFPFATILSCNDSRISTELIFDQGLGDLFSIRLAATRLNVHHNMVIILKRSSIITEMVAIREIGLTGAIYDVETGRVEFTEYLTENNVIYEREAYT